MNGECKIWDLKKKENGKFCKKNESYIESKQIFCGKKLFLNLHLIWGFPFNTNTCNDNFMLVLHKYSNHILKLQLQNKVSVERKLKDLHINNVTLDAEVVILQSKGSPGGLSCRLLHVTCLHKSCHCHHTGTDNVIHLIQILFPASSELSKYSTSVKLFMWWTWFTSSACSAQCEFSHRNLHVSITSAWRHFFLLI